MSDSAEEERLRVGILASLRAQGFAIENNRLHLNGQGKDAVRTLHQTSVAHVRERAKRSLLRHEPALLACIASGTDVVPERIRPELVPVARHTQEELLFRYVKLHWTVPVSSGYGRRIRFLVKDKQNDKVIGVVGLCDPVYSLKCRDNWVEWSQESKQLRLSSVLDAFVLGACPPYNSLLLGKYLAMLLASSWLGTTYKRKYGDASALISGREHTGTLAMITTMSALGRSSVYNKVKYGDSVIMVPLGYTSGSGDFQFSNGMYESILAYAREHCPPTTKNAEWGTGYRNRREVVKKVLKQLGLPHKLAYHGVERQVFTVPRGANVREYLRGDSDALVPAVYDHEEMFDWFRSRWLIPRAKRKRDWRGFERDDYRLWPQADLSF